MNYTKYYIFTKFQILRYELRIQFYKLEFKRVINLQQVIPSLYEYYTS